MEITFSEWEHRRKHVIDMYLDFQSWKKSEKATELDMYLDFQPWKKVKRLQKAMYLITFKSLHILTIF